MIRWLAILILLLFPATLFAGRLGSLFKDQGRNCNLSTMKPIHEAVAIVQNKKKFAVPFYAVLDRSANLIRFTPARERISKTCIYKVLVYDQIPDCEFLAVIHAETLEFYGWQAFTKRCEDFISVKNYNIQRE